MADRERPARRRPRTPATSSNRSRRSRRRTRPPRTRRATERPPRGGRHRRTRIAHGNELWRHQQWRRTTGSGAAGWASAGKICATRPRKGPAVTVLDRNQRTARDERVIRGARAVEQGRPYPRRPAGAGRAGRGRRSNGKGPPARVCLPGRSGSSRPRSSRVGAHRIELGVALCWLHSERPPPSTQSSASRRSAWDGFTAGSPSAGRQCWFRESCLRRSGATFQTPGGRRASSMLTARGYASSRGEFQKVGSRRWYRELSSLLRSTCREDRTSPAQGSQASDEASSMNGATDFPSIATPALCGSGMP